MIAAPVFLLCLLGAPLALNASSDADVAKTTPHSCAEAISGHAAPDAMAHQARPWTWPSLVEGRYDPPRGNARHDKIALWSNPSTAPPLYIAGERTITASQLEDRWFGEDKQRHFAMSFFVTSFGHAAARMAGLDADGATLSGVVVAAAAGLGKEIHDRRGGGIFSVKDLVWDAAGIAVGAVLVRQAR